MDPPLSFKDIIQKIIIARWWIFNTSLILALFMAYISFSTPPVYQSISSVMIETSNRAQKIFNYNVNDDFKISDEIAVIKSRIIAEDVVKELWSSNKRNRLYLFGTKVFMPRGQRLRRPIKKLFTFGKWTPEQNKPPQYGGGYSPEIAQRFYKNVINSLKVYYTRGTNIINIAVSSPNPYEASLIANTVAEVYKKRDKEWSANEYTSLKSFLSNRLSDKEDEIDEIEKKIERYKKENKIYDIEGNVAHLVNNLTTLETEYNSNTLEINLIQSQKKYLTNQLSGLEKGLVSQMLSSINAQLFALRTEVDEKEAELVRNSTIYGKDHEAVLNVKQNLNTLKEQLKEKTNEMIASGLSIVDPLEYRQEIISQLLSYETQLHQFNAKANQIKLLIERYQNEIQDLPEKQSMLGNLDRERVVLENTYAFIRQRMEETRVSVASEPGKVRIIDRAEIMSRPISPNITKNIIMAIIIGAMIGFSISILLEYFDNTLKSVEFIENKKIPILAIIPSIDSGPTGSKKNSYNKLTKKIKNQFRIGSNLQRRLVAHEDPRSPISESYRALRTSLMYTSQNNNSGLIMVSSPGPGEGKTTTIINLAITYANLGKKTLLIDGDLRKPVLHKVFKINNQLGLTQFLSGLEKKWKNIINPTDIDNLNIIYSGAIPPNPSELLGSDEMLSLVKKLKNEYDIILFDAPPIMAVTDAIVLSRLIDKFILVVRFGITDKNSINHTLVSLGNVNTELTGIVLNDLNKKNSYYSHNYYKYHEYYYTSDDDG